MGAAVENRHAEAANEKWNCQEMPVPRVAPVTLLALRKQLPHQARPFRLPLVLVFSYLAFYVCTLMTYWSGWEIISKMGIALLLGLVILFGYHFGSKRGKQIIFNWKESLWIWPYFIGLTVLSYFGSFGHGVNLMPFGWDFLIIAIFCALIMMIALLFKLPAEQTQKYIDALALDNHK